jgi:hypothetical protein
MLPLNTPDPCVSWLGCIFVCSGYGSTGNSSNKSKRSLGDLHLRGHRQHRDCHYFLSFNYVGTICRHSNEDPPPVHSSRPNYHTISQGYVSNWHGSYHCIQCGRHGRIYASCAPDTSWAASIGNDCGPNVVRLLCGSIRPPLASSKALLCVGLKVW